MTLSELVYSKLALYIASVLSTVCACPVRSTTWCEGCVLQVWYTGLSAVKGRHKPAWTRCWEGGRQVFRCRVEADAERWWKLHWFCKSAKPGLP